MHQALLFPLGRKHREQLSVEICQELVPIIHDDGTALSFFCPSTDTLFRAHALMKAEPETIRWIDSFHCGDVLWDIGANVGIYSLYAAKKMRVRVLAFEPSAANYWVMNRNIALNHLDLSVTAFCVALGKRTEIGAFNMADMAPGGACYSFGEPTGAINYPVLGRQAVVFHQGALGFSIDEFVQTFSPPFPTHLKIDVDGAEHEILAGGVRTLGDARVRSISVELDENSATQMAVATEILRRCGFRLQRKEHAYEFDELRRHLDNYLFVKS